MAKHLLLAAPGIVNETDPVTPRQPPVAFQTATAVVFPTASTNCSAKISPPLRPDELPLLLLETAAATGSRLTAAALASTSRVVAAAAK
eukprot:COSAG06_NODE_32672_length_502_cov_0.875931_1_plen_88_part_01